MITVIRNTFTYPFPNQPKGLGRVPTPKDAAMIPATTGSNNVATEMTKLLKKCMQRMYPVLKYEGGVIRTTRVREERSGQLIANESVRRLTHGTDKLARYHHDHFQWEAIGSQIRPTKNTLVGISIPREWDTGHVSQK